MQTCPIPPHASHAIHCQLGTLHALQTQPFQLLVTDYWASLQHSRELQVRGAQLDKEAAELRDEVASLYKRLQLADEAKAAEWRAQAESAQSQLRGVSRDLEVAVRERELLREQVERSAQEARELQAQLADTSTQLEQVKADAAELRDALAQTSAALEHEREARIAAASEVQGALATREAAVVEAERLRADVSTLSRRLVALKEKEAERMNEINKMHEEMLAQAAAMRREADADREAAQLIRNKAGSIAAATLQAVKGWVPQQQQQQQHSAAPHNAALPSQASQASSSRQPAPAGPQAAADPALAHSSHSQGSGGAGAGGLVGQVSSSFSGANAPSWPAAAAAFKGGFTAPTVLGRMFSRSSRSGPPPHLSGPALQPQLSEAGPSQAAGLTTPQVSTQFQPGPSPFIPSPSPFTVDDSHDDMQVQQHAGAAQLSDDGSEAAALAAVESAVQAAIQSAAQSTLPLAPGVSEGLAGAWDVVMPPPPSGADAPALPPVGLHELMGLPPAGGACDVDLALPKAPYRSMVAHRGGCCALAVQPTGHLLVSCGLDREVALWDLTVMRAGAGPHQHLHGMSGGVNDIAFVADGSQVLAAGADKSLRLWNVQTGSARHTLTGHAGAVTCCAASPLDARCAASIAEDRTLRLWDLGRGFCAHSGACGAKMATALAMSRDGNTIATGHVDGGVLLWDVRQCWRGHSQPLSEAKVLNTQVTGLSGTANDSLLLLCGKDGSVLLWDFRMHETVQALKASRFVPGTQSSMGRPRCHLSMSFDQRWVAAGGADGIVYVWDLHPPGRQGRHSASGAQAGPSHPVLALLHHHKEPVVATAWSCDANVLVSADKAGQVAFWSLTGWKE